MASKKNDVSTEIPGEDFSQIALRIAVDQDVHQLLVNMVPVLKLSAFHLQNRLEVVVDHA